MRRWHRRSAEAAAFARQTPKTRERMKNGGNDRAALATFFGVQITPRTPVRRQPRSSYDDDVIGGYIVLVVGST